MGTHSAIQSALYTHLAALSPACPIAIENDDSFVPPNPDDAVLPQISVVTFPGGAPVEGEEYSVSIDGTSYSVEALAGESLADVLGRLADEIFLTAEVGDGTPTITITGLSDGVPFSVGTCLPAGTTAATTQEAFLSNQWIRPTILPGESAQSSLGDFGLNRHDGVFQIDVFVPKGIGWGPAKDRVDAVVSHFKRGTLLTADGISVRIVNTWPHRGVDVDDFPGWYMTPVTATFYSFTSND